MICARRGWLGVDHSDGSSQRCRWNNRAWSTELRAKGSTRDCPSDGTRADLHRCVRNRSTNPDAGPNDAIDIGNRWAGHRIRAAGLGVQDDACAPRVCVDSSHEYSSRSAVNHCRSIGEISRTPVRRVGSLCVGEVDRAYRLVGGRVSGRGPDIVTSQHDRCYAGCDQQQGSESVSCLKRYASHPSVP